MSSTSERIPPSPPAARPGTRIARLRLAKRRHLLIGAAALTTAGLVTGAGAAAAWESGTVASYWQHAHDQLLASLEHLNARLDQLERPR